MPDSIADTPVQSTPPAYDQLVRFLIEPFLETPDSLRVDCEISPTKARVLIRLAFEGSDKGRVFGRGGRNIQAIRTVLEAMAKATGYSAHLDVYGGLSQGHDGGSERDGDSQRSAPRRSPGPRRPAPRGRSQH